jgi:hypothetical protein
MILRDMDDSFSKVAFENANGNSHFFIDTAPLSSLLAAAALFVSFTLMHAYGAIRAPSFTSTKRQFVPINSTNRRAPVGIDLIMSQLERRHRIVNVNCSLVAKTADKLGRVGIDVISHTRTLKDGKEVSLAPDDRARYGLRFAKGSLLSSAFRVASVPVVEIDTLELHMYVKGDYSDVDGFSFAWDFTNPLADQYLFCGKLILSTTMGYMLVVFLFYLKWDAERFTQRFLIVVGVLGVVASNPLKLLIPVAYRSRLMDHLLMAAFTAAYRMFLLLQLELLRGRETTVSPVLIGVHVIAFIMYAFLDGTASFGLEQRMIRNDGTVLDSEVTRSRAHMIYLGITCLLLSLVVLNADGAHLGRLVLVAISVLITGGVTLGMEVIGLVLKRFTDSVADLMVMPAVHLNCAAMALFLLRSDADAEYAGLKSNPGDEADIALEVELEDRTVPTSLTD